MKMTKETFTKKIEKAAVLSGQLIDKALPGALYEELKSEDDKDVLQALKDVAYSAEKLCLANVIKNLTRHKGARLESEALKFKEKEKAEIDAFIANREMPDEVRAFIEKFKES